jgi:ribosomal protein L24E
MFKMAKAKCVFCGVEQDDFKGTYLAKNDGSMLYFSSGKCFKNFTKLKRDKRKVRWTEAFHVTRKKRIAKSKEKAEKI